jgi:hypothetical protein
MDVLIFWHLYLPENLITKTFIHTNASGRLMRNLTGIDLHDKVAGSLF